MQDFDFENWSDLHSSDPAEFERKREAALQAFIEQANPDSRRMLEQTLFTLQMHKQKAKSPLQSAIFASNLMWESFGKLRNTMDEARHVFEEARPTLSLVGGSQMTQIDSIVTRWAAGLPSTPQDEVPAQDDAKALNAVVESGATGQDEQFGDAASSAKPVMRKQAAQSGARIIAFPTRR